MTCLGSKSVLLANKTFDFCIVDESTQVMLPTVLKPLYHAKKFVLVGDPEQLGPIIKHKDAK